MDSDKTIFILFVALLLAFGRFGLWRQFKEVEQEKKCPQCDKYWAAGSQDEETIGIFQKGHHRGKSSYYGNHTKMVWYEKYKLHYKCKYCGQEWVSYKSKKIMI